jgi:hypothetical protein
MIATLASIPDIALDVFPGRRIVDVEAKDQRSHCYRARLDDGTWIFVKQARENADGEWSADVPREGRVVREIYARWPAVAPLAPAALTVDPVARTLVTEDLTGYRPLDEVRQAAGGVHPDSARWLGRALARVHGARPEPRDAHPSEPLGQANRAAQMCAMWSAPTPRMVSMFPAGFTEVAVRVRSAGLIEPLEAVVAAWQTDCLIHGDVKSDNVFCADDVTAAGQGGSDADEPVRLIDWELATWGDPRWDVGSAIGDYLFSWLRSIVFDAEGALSDWIGTADPPLERVTDEIAGLIAEYRVLSPEFSRDGDALAWMGCAGAFLLQRLASSAMHSPLLSAQSLAFLQVAKQLLVRPEQMAEVVL